MVLVVWQIDSLKRGGVALAFPGGVAPKFGSEKVSRYTGVSQLHLRVSRYTVQLSQQVSTISTISSNELQVGKLLASEIIVGSFHVTRAETEKGAVARYRRW